jgi:toxin YoeB
MGKYRVKIEKLAESHLRQHYRSGNKAIIIKLQKILFELSIHPYKGEGQPEQLKHELTGFWSRRINRRDRLIYKVEEEVVTVLVISAMGHYSDK